MVEAVLGQRRKGKRMTATFTPAIRRNWGYWDGRTARALNRLPPWCGSGRRVGCLHPSDKPYGQGFWLGWYGEPAPDKYSQAAVAAETRAHG